MAGKAASLSINIIADAAKAKSGLSEAQAALKKFAKEFDAAQGASAKFKAGTTAAFDYVKKNAITFAAAAGAAIGAFVVKSVVDFQKLAIAAGKFSDATGLSTEQASRFIEVAGDFGVESTAVEKSISFMNKTLGNSPELFEKLGIEIRKTSGGATDVNATFLSVVDRLNKIQDPAARAAAATRLLGRGWAEMAELIAMGSDELAASLAAVSNQKVISPEEQAEAERLRAEVDRLKDSWDNFANTVGGTVIPALADLLTFISDAGESIGDLGDWISRNLGEQTDFVKNAKAMKEEQQFLNEAWKEGYRAQIDAQSASAKLKVEMELQAAAVEAARLEWDAFRNGLNIKAESIRLTQDIEDFRVKWAGTTEEAKRKSREYQLELIAIQTQLANSALAIVGLATTAQNTRIQLMIETGRLEQALSLIGAIRAGMNQLAGAVTPDRVERIVGQAPTGGAGTGKTTTTTTQKKTVEPAATFGGKKIETKRYAGLAAGGTLLSSGGVVVGENGPELVNLPRGASVIPSIPSRKMMGGGTVYNITLQAGLVSSPDQVGQEIIEAIRRAERRSGKVFASA
jgi:hypothetical protein